MIKKRTNPTDKKEYSYAAVAVKPTNKRLSNLPIVS